MPTYSINASVRIDGQLSAYYYKEIEAPTISAALAQATPEIEASVTDELAKEPLPK